MKKEKIAFIGCGIIGAGLAVNAMMHDYQVAMVDISDEMLDAAKTRVSDILKIMSDNNICTEKEAAHYAKDVGYTTSIKDAVKDAVLVQECVPERLDLKKSTYAEVEKYCNDDTIIASSTSAMMPSDLQEGALNPERIMVAHPYNPSYLLPLIELCGGRKTTEEALQRAKTIYEGFGKVPVICRKEISGYIVNRASWAMLKEAEDTVLNGICTVEDMDKAIMFGPGIRTAVTGQLLTISLGINGGYKARASKYGLEPNETDAILAEGVDVELKNRSPETGNTPEEVCAWRDKMIAEILKLQGMI